MGLAIGTATYVNDVGKDMMLEMQYRGKPVLPEDKSVKTSYIDLICSDDMEVKDSIPKKIPTEELMGN